MLTYTINNVDLLISPVDIIDTPHVILNTPLRGRPYIFFRIMVDIVTMHINLILLYADINESPIYIIMLHIDIIYLAYRGPKLATIQMKS